MFTIKRLSKGKFHFEAVRNEDWGTDGSAEIIIGTGNDMIRLMLMVGIHESFVQRIMEGLVEQTTGHWNWYGLGNGEHLLIDPQNGSVIYGPEIAVLWHCVAGLGLNAEEINKLRAEITGEYPCLDEVGGVEAFIIKYGEQAFERYLFRHGAKAS
jgi:hypothetical protein